MLLLQKEKKFLSFLKNKIKGGGWKLLEVMDTFMALSVVIVSQVYSYLQTQQVAYIKYGQLLVCQPHAIKFVVVVFF